jgi:mannose-6-phosphate isomerase-like protein (cupin superfamily)
MATTDVIHHATPESFRAIPGFEASEMRECDLGKLDAEDVRITVVRNKPGFKWVGSPWHMHDFKFAVLYVLKGWTDFEFEGVGQVRLGAGTILNQPAMNRHREGEMSEDFEGIAFHSPPVFGTTAFLYDEASGKYHEQYIADVGADEEFGKLLDVAAG